MASRKINLIAAACENMGIGKNGNLPWRLKKEMAYFTKMTKSTTDPAKKNAIIMGRKTWDSIPIKYKPMDGRINIVLTRTPEDLKEKLPPGVMACSSLDEALTSIENNLIEHIWVIGGSSVYEEAMKHPSFHRIYLTEIKKYYDCDTFFPKIDDNIFKLLEDHGSEDDRVPTEKQTENEIDYFFRVYEKKT